jgi:hypothetical protein
MTARYRVHGASVHELVERFKAIALAQHEANWLLQTERYNRLYKQSEKVESELKARQGDQRRSLIPLLQSGNVQVRMNAAFALLAIEHDLARQALESFRDYGQMPQAAEASSMISAIDEGRYVPS